VTGVALLGAGFMARIHAAAYAGLPEADVRVVCALTEPEALAERLGADVSDDWEAAISTPGVDVVDVCLPTPLHRPVVERALEAGRHVLVEKPVALTLADADAIAAAARDSGRVLMVGHVLRFFAEIAEMRRVIGSGELGRPLAATAVRLSAPPDWNDWMLDPARSGGTLVDLMVHDFDVLADLLGPARRVYATAAAGGRHVTALVEHERGEASVEGSHAMPASYPFTAGLRLLCERGAIEHRFETVAGDEGGNIGGGVSSVLRSYPPRAIDLVAADPWQRMIEHFLTCVERGEEPADGTFEQARAALAVALAAQRSIESGRPERVSSFPSQGRETRHST
jgi:predicted dehydrogenase